MVFSGDFLHPLNIMLSSAEAFNNGSGSLKVTCLAADLLCSDHDYMLFQHDASL